LQDGLDDHARDGLGLPIEDPGDRFDRALPAGVSRVGLGIRGAEDVEEERAEDGAEGVDAAEADGAERVAVVGAGESDEAAAVGARVLLPVLEGNLDGDLDGGGAVVAEEDAGEARRCGSGELGGEERCVGVRHAGE
jgi:hypothetical protein